ncbi:AMP-binding protein [Streptomyces sp. ISL-22]|uniref:class I adenylate-forming enzyme family protein n=1 Tax=unclassified Streptomyces TaxID=2593676 RepID=UPI001BEBBD36|nr:MULTISPECIES: AMP-binding protein [unclassified Streptomyces]MBT2423771.1 AMP-binding protein [Streptomyces sp. ISL-24]MBT2433491.1 AMP-binding protein [Streptomyces sp. ISL-22]
MTSLAYLPWYAGPGHAGRPCVRDDRHELTYAEFAAWVDAAAEQFAERGIGRGSVVAVMLPNRVELLVAMVAAWRLGAAATPINPAFTAEEAAHQITDAGSALVVNLGPDAPDGGRPGLAVDELRRTPVGTTLPAARTSPDELALLVYTSGSTGRPKGVMLDHANLDAMTSMMVATMRSTADDHCLLFLPLFHVNAICASFLSPMRCGARLTVMGRFTVDAFRDAVERHRPTYFSAVPTIYAMLLAQPRDADFSSVRFAVCGAAPASKELLDAVEKRFGLVLAEGYGLTECTCAATSNRWWGERRAGTVGQAFPGVRVEVVDPDGAILPRGERGEVVVQGPNVMRGYLNRPDATAEALRDGWLHTGDVGVIDEDGYLRIVDRIKDLIIRGGENIYPKEIETVLMSVEGVYEAAVIGQSDERFGEAPFAYVAVLPGAAVTAEELIKACTANLARYKVPVGVHVVEAVPKNPVGKIDKPTLRRQHQTATTGA